MFAVGKSLFTSNRPYYSNNMYVTSSSGTGTASGASGDETYLIKQLLVSETMTTITTYYTSYISGQFDEIARIFLLTNPVENEFSKLSLALTKLSKNSKYTTYEMVRASILKSLQVLQQGLYQYMAKVTATGQLETAQAKAKIVDDINLLNEYIEKLNNTNESYVFPEVVVDAPIFTIRPEYEKYIELYGFPAGGVFDPVLLGQIIAEMNS